MTGSTALSRTVAAERPLARRDVHTPSIPPVVRGYPIAVVAHGLIFIGGLRGQRPDGRTAFDALPENFRKTGFSGFSLSDHLEARFAEDGWCAHENLHNVVLAAGGDPDQVLRLHIWMKDKRVFPVYERIRMAWQSAPAASSCLGVSQVAGRFGDLCGLEAIAVAPGENPLLPARTNVTRHDNPAFPSAAFYSQATRCGYLVFLAGHIPIATDQPGFPLIAGYPDVPEDGRSLSTGRSHTDSRQGKIAAQTWYVYDRIRANLQAQGLDIADIRHVSVMLQDIRDFGTFHRVHREFFPHEGPALVIAGFSEVGHRGTTIEIEPTALDPEADIDTETAPWTCVPPFAGPAAERVGPHIFFAGMLGLRETGEVVAGIADISDARARRVVADLSRFERQNGFAAQCWAAWQRLADTCAAFGLSTDCLVKTTVYVRDPSDIAIYEDVREHFLPSSGRLPAMDIVAVPNPGPVAEALVQIEATGACP